MILDITAAFFLALLAGMGIGGGGLLVIYLTLAKNYPQIDAQAMNLLFFVFAAAASLFIHIKKRTLDIRLITTFATTGIMGSLLGSAAASGISPDISRKLFGGMLIISGIITLAKLLRKREKVIDNSEN